VWPEHTALMRGLPATLSPQYRSNVKRFLCHLEQQGKSWSDLVPADSDVHPAALEQAVNAGIRDDGLNIGTRAALNLAFRLSLQAESGRVRLAPTLPEHATLMRGLPATLSQQYRSRINRFLCHLEQQGSSWSDLVPADNDVRPAALEQAVNEGMRDNGLKPGTRAALNQAFGLVLQGESGQVRLAPTLPEHATLIRGLPAALSPPHRSHINRFLCHLEQQDSSWSDLVPADSGERPDALEQAVNAGMRDHGLDRGTRAALNRAFGLFLLAESGRVRLAPTLPEHATLMSGLPAELSQPYRSHINRFLCHLEQQDSSWSDLVPADSGERPAALEQAVNEGMRDHSLDRGTRAALNRAFRYTLGRG
jgi:translation elongation factor EF-1beta